MNSLVGYGVSSESDSDGDVNTARFGPVKERGDEKTVDKKTRNFLLESGSSDSASESEPEGEDPQAPSSITQSPSPASSAAYQHTGLPAPCMDSLPPNKLPPPPLSACSHSSVFANPFKAQADQKLSALQKHVPLTMQAKPSQIGGKRMCLSYRKDGRCRFGIKCKFAHDSDLQTSGTHSDSQHHHPAGSDEAPAAEHIEPHAGGAGSQRLTEEEESGGQLVKKKRVGLSNTLIPPKRAMKQYAMHRDRERVNLS